MKFKISKTQRDILVSKFNEEGDAEIELEPIPETAREAILNQKIKECGMITGYEMGYKEGFYDGRYPERNYNPRYSHCCCHHCCRT